jgi:hypothetical protein
MLTQAGMPCCTAKTSPAPSAATAPATIHADTARFGLVVGGVIVSGQ